MLEYYYKISKVNGKRYLQLWRRDKSINLNEQVYQCGTAQKLYNNLVNAGIIKKNIKD